MKEHDEDLYLDNPDKKKKKRKKKDGEIEEELLYGDGESLTEKEKKDKEYKENTLNE